MPHALPPYQHPTTICFVDDNAAFLTSLTLELPDHWAFVCSSNPAKTLHLINQSDPFSPLVERCFSADNSTPDNTIIHVDFAVLEEEIKRVERFAQISVLLVDFAMPTMTGIEFFEQVKNPRIKKVLLTGVADEKTAVDAFNRGVIDRYIPKASLSSKNTLVQQIESLQRDYFDQFFEHFNLVMGRKPPEFLIDPQVRRYFTQLIAEQHIAEFYLTDDPPGYLMLTANGEISQLIVISQSALDDQLKLAKQFGAPEALINQLSAGQKLGYIYEHPADYWDSTRYPWDEMFLPAIKIQGDVTWYVGWSNNPPIDIDFDPEKSSYNAYLAMGSALD